MPVAFITGVTGQDGSYLSDLLLSKSYEVHGAVRRTSLLRRSRIDHLYQDPEIYGKQFFLHYLDLNDPTTLRRILTKIQPDEIYHLAGQSHVGLSFEIPESTCDLTAMGTLRLLEIIRDLPKVPKLFHASSSEVFGKPDQSPQNESTPFRPVTPYGCAKAFATQMVSIYRNAFHMHAGNGIFFNHESPRRGENFVTRKICRAAAEISAGKRTELRMGDLKACRDWGDARDYVRGMWLMLQQDQPDDYVLATGKLHSVEDVVSIAFQTVKLDWREYVRRDERFDRPQEPCNLVGDSSKAKQRLNWQPQTDFFSLISEMTESEINRIKLQPDSSDT